MFDSSRYWLKHIHKATLHICLNLDARILRLRCEDTEHVDQTHTKKQHCCITLHWNQPTPQNTFDLSHKKATVANLSIAFDFWLLVVCANACWWSFHAWGLEESENDSKTEVTTRYNKLEKLFNLFIFIYLCVICNDLNLMLVFNVDVLNIVM